MGKPSSIETLPPDILERLQELLRDPRVTQLDATAKINAILTDQALEPISKSAVNRYSLKMDRIGEKLTQSRAIADMWIAKLGSQPAGKVGQLLNEVVRNIAFDAAMHMAEDEEPADPKLIKELSIAIEKLERAASENEKRAEQIREQERKRAQEKLDELGRKPGSGIDSETLKRIRQEVYGLAE